MYCESGNTGASNNNPYYLFDPFWDGTAYGCDVHSGCSTCTEIGKLWFYRKLSVQVAGNFEVRICKDEGQVNQDIVMNNWNFMLTVRRIIVYMNTGKTTACVHFVLALCECCIQYILLLITV